jgi:hypothetical protein
MTVRDLYDSRLEATPHGNGRGAIMLPRPRMGHPARRSVGQLQLRELVGHGLENIRQFGRIADRV